MTDKNIEIGFVSSLWVQFSGNEMLDFDTQMRWFNALWHGGNLSHDSRDYPYIKYWEQLYANFSWSN